MLAVVPLDHRILVRVLHAVMTAGRDQQRRAAGLEAHLGGQGQAGPVGSVEQSDHFWQFGHDGTIRGESAAGRWENATPFVKLCPVPAGDPHGLWCGAGGGLALAGPLREAWRRPWGPPHGGDELTDAPAEEFLELDGGRVHLLRGGRTAAASGRDAWSGWSAATGPGLTGSSLASQGFWRRLPCSAKRSARVIAATMPASMR